jgi:hypothetical protein
MLGLELESFSGYLCLFQLSAAGCQMLPVLSCAGYRLVGLDTAKYVLRLHHPQGILGICGASRIAIISYSAPPGGDLLHACISICIALSLR